VTWPGPAQLSLGLSLGRPLRPRSCKARVGPGQARPGNIFGPPYFLLERDTVSHFCYFLASVLLDKEALAWPAWHCLGSGPPSSSSGWPSPAPAWPGPVPAGYFCFLRTFGCFAVTHSRGLMAWGYTYTVPALPNDETR
jgi:hypothetical protein